MTSQINMSVPANDPELLDMAGTFFTTASELATARREAGDLKGLLGEIDADHPLGEQDLDHEADMDADEGNRGSHTRKPSAPAAPKKEAPKAPEKTETPPAEKPTETDAPEKTSGPVAGELLDVLGLPHDSRINTSSKVIIDKGGKHGPGGSWKVTKGTADEYREECRTHWETLGYGLHLVDGVTAYPYALKEGGGPEPAKEAAPKAPTKAAPKAPAAPKKAKTLEERMTNKCAGATLQSFYDNGWTVELMEEKGYLEPTEGEATTDITDFTTLVVDLCNPALEDELITQEQVDGIVAEVTEGAAPTLSAVPNAKVDAFIPEIARRVQALLDQ